MASMLLAFASCTKAPEINVIPCPESVEQHDGIFRVAGVPVKADQSLDSESLQWINSFAQNLTLVTGKKSEVVSDATGKCIEFALDKELAPEEYFIDITKKGVKIQASAVAGFRNASQTIGQMLPAAYYGKAKAAGENWVLPCATIKDKPRFAYRGMHLDVARHFFDVNEVKRYLDVMAAYKLNRFHWHLTEDQGWRIEIKKYPKLTEVGAWRDSTMIGKNWNEFDHTRYGGFYTQEEIKDVVAYAADLGITVIPEIDLPGHMVAALTSYPELGCTGGPYTVRPVWGIADEVLCPGKEITFKFIEDVLDEVMGLFQSEYIHIGGDESPRNRWKACPKCQKKLKELGLKKEAELQTYINKDIEAYLAAKGRDIIGWDETLEGGLSEKASVMSWRGYKGGIEAARQHHHVVMSPTNHCYIDYYQLKNHDAQPLAIGGYLPVSTVYSMEPVPAELTEEEGKFIVGAQCNLWTEYVVSPDHAMYMLLPRLAAMCEVQWMQPQAKNYEEFSKKRLPAMQSIYRSLGYKYCSTIE